MLLHKLVYHFRFALKAYMLRNKARYCYNVVFPDCYCYGLNSAGYGKMPGYEHIFTDFLLSLVQSKYKRHLSGS